MPGFVVSGLFALLAASALALIWRARRDRDAARAEAEALRGAHASRDRSFGLLAREMQSLGLALLGHAGGGRDHAAAAASIAEGAQRLLALSDELTELLAVHGGLRVLHAQRLSLSPLIEEAVAATTAQLGPSRRDWRIAPEFAAITLSADARALRGALEQVLARAARMTRDGDWIGLRPVITDDSLALIVEDEGAGLGAADAAPEAGPTEAPSMTRTRGLGFGLAVARALLEAHGGSLRIEALHGVGARAWLTLPRERLLAA
jgi:signal transduction histidine kinase